MAVRIDAARSKLGGFGTAKITGFALLACGQFTPGYLRLEEKGGCAFLLTPNIPEREAEPRMPVAPQARAWLMKS
ncbi:hypothetical protein TW79_14675 [Tritonibacter mobilis]|uniref:Uncharacterized protein n=1 Tax=Tritonibacter mobilis F1926 TaxID=1265309 RepID=A0A1B1A7W6_9RHOB|nr:hypothetical protein K529_017925 [Tritonibacter mobilis F1926]KJZ23508.1 hypothetical protein TW79_14675 [Tritonibacter mobilis]